MKIRGSLLWLKVAFVMMLVPAIGYASNFYTGSINTWRNVSVALKVDHPVVSYGADYHAYVTIKNIGDSALSVPLNGECHVGYKLLDRQKKVIREKTFENGSCINFEYNNLKLVPDEYEVVDFYIGELEPGFYRAIFEVPPKGDLMVDFEVLEPVDMTVGIGEECGGIARRICSTGLVCSVDGVLPGAPGICVAPEFSRLNYIPDEQRDFVGWNREKYVYEPIFTNVESFEVGELMTFENKTGYVLKEDFEKYMFIYTGRDVEITGSDIYVRRDIALTAVYRTMYRSRHPEDLKVYHFIDSKWSQFGNYIEASAELGFVDVPPSRIFAIDGWLKWADLRAWLREF